MSLPGSFRRLLLCVVVQLLLIAPLSALVIRVYVPSRHDRFLSFPASPSHNPQFMHAGFDLTGVGWDNGRTDRQLTMVSPMHFVGANHYKPGTNATLKFLSSDGVVRSYTVASRTTITNDSGQSSDLFIGRLSQPIPSSDKVGYHPYLNLPFESQYTNQDVILLGKAARGAVQRTSAVTDVSSGSTNSTKVVSMVYTKSGVLDGDDDAYYQGGDSGSPVFVDQDGKAAIIGTNSLVSSTGNPTITCYANFVPHYADKLNAVMEADGYRMTKAIPGNTTLSLNHQLPAGPIRAGHPFVIELTVTNTDLTLAENLRLTNTFTNGATVVSAAGADWFDESSGVETKARKAQLPILSNTVYSLNLSLAESGTAQHQVVFSCDQFAASTQNFSIDVIGSFLSFSSGLADSSATGDDDLDGINNLLEYVFGGDPAQTSQLFPGTNIPLLPAFKRSGGIFEISYIRRKDYVARAISYELESSTTLASASWGDASSLITKTTQESIDDDFEKIIYELSGGATDRFFRIKATVNE